MAFARAVGRIGTVGLALALLGATALSCGADDDTAPTAHIATSLGEPHPGQYNLGPVAFTGSFWNSCAPYTAELESDVGSLLAGLAIAYNGDGSLCDTCILVETAKGKSVTARVITTGDTHTVNDIDLSQAAYDAINSGEYPRSMTWQLVKCPDGAGPLRYQFQTQANADWTSLWVRNGRLPIRNVEVESPHHPSFAALTRGRDGTLTDASGFGGGPFTIRVSAEGGQVITDTFPAITPGAVLTGASQFQ
jgi:expansin (peptidoglycan-binding protein)